MHHPVLPKHLLVLLDEKNDVVNKWLDDYHHYIQSSTRAEDKDIAVVVLEDSDAENEDHDECAAGTINPDDMQAKNDIPTKVLHLKVVPVSQRKR